jgi:hypothetical protein
MRSVEVEANTSRIVTTVTFRTCTQDGSHVSGQFVLRVVHKLDECGLAELLAKYGLASVFRAMDENSLVGVENGAGE